MTSGRHTPTPPRSRLGPGFWTLWTASTLSALGDGVRYVALPLLAAGVTDSPWAVAVTYAAGFLPWPLFGLIAGVVVDRADRRRLMWRADAARALLVGGLAALLVAQHSTIALLAAVSFLLGTAQILFDNAASAVVPMLVPTAALERANAWLQSAQTATSTLFGAPLGAALFALHASAPLAVDAATFAVAAALTFSLHGAFTPAGHPAATGTGQDIAEGLRWLWRHRLLRTLCLLVCAMNATLSAAQAILVLYALHVLHLTTIGYGALFAVLTVGGVLGTMAAPVLRPRIGFRPVVVGCALGQAAALAAVGLTSHVVIAVVSVMAVGATSAAWNVVTISLRQTLVPPQLLGRVTSSYRTVALSGMPVGAVLGGFAADVYGLHSPFVIGAALLSLMILLCLPWLRPSAGRLSQCSSRGS